MGSKNVGKNISEYFRYKLVQKTVALVLLLFFNFNIFSEIVPDPASIGTKVTRTASGVDQIDIARPTGNGTSYNSLKELQVGERGLILNNNKNIVVQTEIAGLVVRNRNLDNGTEANLIITETFPSVTSIDFRSPFSMFSLPVVSVTLSEFKKPPPFTWIPFLLAITMSARLPATST